MPNPQQWKVMPLDVLNAGPVVPVIVIEKIEQAVPLAQALLKGGIRVLEVTLRSAAAIDAIRLLSREVPDAIVGAGTVANPADLQAVAEAGAVFAISPGLTPSLLDAANQGPIALIPGIASASELMLGMELGYTAFKFFPAEAAGGVPMLKSIGGPFPQITFCPTGGVSQDNYNDYLALANVACVGGSWIVPSREIESGNWDKITQLAEDAVAGSRR
ncbi:MAG: bifunctional 4-hydroxy-2-oxoglutarate aldolase/2-dehydro-3-deoxy-phosphogluconate aldolase [Desulfobacterales bacterium]|nr:bifunctional 4-hydroxy-2-oxoglutarate aldolase/2-dehydro-3-deoxy-phosphogluconate aldolase [Desulfobacterales bacterium]